MKKLMKCSVCMNVGEFSYVDSRNLNENGEVFEVVGSKELWVSYFRCPFCGNVEVEIYPPGEKPVEK